MGLERPIRTRARILETRRFLRTPPERVHASMPGLPASFPLRQQSSLESDPCRLVRQVKQFVG